MTELDTTSTTPGSETATPTDGFEANGASDHTAPRAEYQAPAEPEYHPSTEPEIDTSSEPEVEIPAEPDTEFETSAGSDDAATAQIQAAFEPGGESLAEFEAPGEGRSETAGEAETEFEAPAESGTEAPTEAPTAEPETEFEAPTEAVAEPDTDAPAPTETAAAESEPAGGVAQATAQPPEPQPAPSAGQRTIGRFIADALRAAGVRYAFTVPGESFLGLLDAFEAAGIRVVASRHEGAASFMAEAHGQLTGRPAVCLGTRAVGGANLGIGIHTARQDSTPMFAVTGQVERAFQGREAFQEIDQVGTLGALAKWAVEPRAAEDVAAAVAEAVRQALGGRPGPVLLSLPEDLLDEPAPDDAQIEAARSTVARPSDEEIRAVIELLTSARRPVILAGAGVLRARTSTELTRFAELVQVPVIAAWRRADVISNDHPLYLGMAGMSAPASVRERLEAADALLVLGSRLNEATTYGYSLPRPDQPWAHVDLAAGRSSGSPAPLISVTADAKAFVKAANDRLLGRAVLDAERVSTRQANNAADRAAWEASTVVDEGAWDGPGIHPGRVVTTLRRVLPDDAILTVDAGNFGGWAARGFRFRRPGTFLGSTSGAMGYGLPAAISAALVHRDRHVVALVGDGGLGMTLAELETAVRVGARVVVLCFDNERYGTIRMWQERRKTGLGVATELGPVDFAAIARACGARGVRVEHDADFEPALRTALVADRATVIQLTLDRAWLSVDEHP